MRSRFRILVAAAVALTLSSAAVATSGSVSAAPSPITVWTDAVHAPAITTLLANGFRGTPVVVVTKDLTAIRDELATVPPESAPDVIWADATWTGQLAAAGSIVAVPLTTKVTASFRASALSAFAVGATGYGVPVQVSNLALITNASLVPNQPSTFASLSSTALALKSSGTAKVPFAVGQGGDSDGYAMYPLFSGLGGYFFGRDAEGVLDPTRVGISNKTFAQNSTIIDSWNVSGLINSARTGDQARRAFARQRSAFWLAGPEEMANLLKLGFSYRITSVPSIVPSIKPAPLLRIQGFMVTKFAAAHGVQDLSMRLAGRFMASAPSQLALAAASGLIPANRTAVSQSSTRLQAFDMAGVDGVPVPNIPQQALVWAPYGTAWVSSTAGTGAILAKPAFRLAKRTVKSAIG